MCLSFWLEKNHYILFPFEHLYIFCYKNRNGVSSLYYNSQKLKSLYKINSIGQKCTESTYFSFTLIPSQISLHGYNMLDIIECAMDTVINKTVKVWSLGTYVEVSRSRR